MMCLPDTPGPIGVFDSGYGGLTILEGIRQLMPGYDYLYLGDNARAPYGTRSFDVVYEFTRQAVVRMFELGCHLVVLGCNTASAKALPCRSYCSFKFILVNHCFNLPVFIRLPFHFWNEYSTPVFSLSIHFWNKYKYFFIKCCNIGIPSL